MHDTGFCFWHNPETEDEAAEARRLGGLRRRREKAVAGAYQVSGLDSAASLRRVLEIATIDTLALDNSISRSRTLISAVLAGAKLMEVDELEARIERLEAALSSRSHAPVDEPGSALLETA
jgi:hypothetical protein